MNENRPGVYEIVVVPSANDDSAEQERAAAAEREAKRQAAVVEAATTRDQQQRPRGSVASMPVILNAHALRSTFRSSTIEWQPTDEVGQDDEPSLSILVQLYRYLSSMCPEDQNYGSTLVAKLTHQSDTSV
eukprot:COSAG02_NODE_3156_length_7262_cov_12.166132_4_plen_131_part_00